MRSAISTHAMIDRGYPNMDRMVRQILFPEIAKQSSGAAGGRRPTSSFRDAACSRRLQQELTAVRAASGLPFPASGAPKAAIGHSANHLASVRARRKRSIIEGDPIDSDHHKIDNTGGMTWQRNQRTSPKKPSTRSSRSSDPARPRGKTLPASPS